MKKGFKLSEEHKRKIGLSKLGKKRLPFSLEWRKKIGLACMGNKGRLGQPLSEEHKNKISIFMKGKKHVNHSVTVQRILKECEELKKQGFRVIPTGGKVIPDIIAIKDNKVFAVEVEYGYPNYAKYTEEIRQYFDDIIWIIRKKYRSKFFKESA